MKAIVFVFVCVAIANLAMAQKNNPLYVAAKNGLSVREQPSATAKVIDKLNYGTAITLADDKEDRSSISTEGMMGFWLKINNKGKTGYIVSSYLLNNMPPKLTTVKLFKDYLQQLAAPFGAKLIVKKGNMNSFEDAGTITQKQLYKNGAEWHQYTAYEYNCDMYILPNCTLQQGFVLLRLIPEFADIFSDKDVYPTENKVYKKADKELTITVTKPAMPIDGMEIEKIHIEYADGATVIFEMFMLEAQLVVSLASGL